MTKLEIYLDRHIELDGDCHSILAKKLVASLCKSEEDWQLAEKWATFARFSNFCEIIFNLSSQFFKIPFSKPEQAIEARLQYWDEVAKKIEKAKRNSKSSRKSGCSLNCSDCTKLL